MPQRADDRPGDQPDPRGGRGDRAEQHHRARPGRGRVLVAGQRVVPGGSRAVPPRPPTARARCARSPSPRRSRPARPRPRTRPDPRRPAPAASSSSRSGSAASGWSTGTRHRPTGTSRGPVTAIPTRRVPVPGTPPVGPCVPGHRYTRTGSALSPLVKFDRIRRGSPASSNRLHPPGQRGQHHLDLQPGQVHAQAQVRAAAAEAQVPVRAAPDVERVRVGRTPPRPGSPRRTTAPPCRPARIAAPPSSVSAAAVRRMKCVGQLHRITSSVAVSSSPGSARSRSHCSGYWQKASTPWAMAIRVVSLPATTRIEKKLSRSVSLSRSPSTSAPTSLDSRSSPGSAQPPGHDLAAQVPQLLAVRAAEREQAVGVGVVPAPNHVGHLRVGVGDQPVAQVDEQVQVGRGQAHDLGQHPDRDFLGHRVHEVEGLAAAVQAAASSTCSVSPAMKCS